MSARIQQIYIAMFGRPADPLGLNFWNNATNNGANLAPIVNALAGTAEYQARFAGQSNVQLVNSIYQSLFGRDADVAGLTFFVNQLSSGRMNLGTIAINILDGAQGTDKSRIDNKVTAATAFTAAIDTTAEILAYNSAAVPAAQAFLAGITDVATTIPNAAATDAAVAAIVGNNPGVPGVTVALTTGADNIAGGGGNDTVSGFISATAAQSTLTAADVINGGAGVDTLNVTTAVAGNVLAGALVSNVEVVGIRAIDNVALTLDAAGLTNVNLTGTNTDTTTLSNLATGATVTVGSGANLTGKITSGYVAAATTANLAYSGGTSGAVDVTGAGLTTVNIASSGAANTAGAITVAAAKTVNVAATTNLTVTSIATTGANSTLNVSGAAASVSLGTLDLDFKTVNASGLTAGGITATLAEATAAVTGGAGSDVITTGVVLTTGTVNAGAGTDTLAVANNAHITAALGAKYTNFETLRVLDGITVDAGHVAGITAIQIVDTSAAATIVNNLSAAQAGAITIRDGNGAATLAVKDASNVGQIDTVKVTFNNGNTTLNEDINGGSSTFTLAGVENLELTAIDQVDVTQSAAASGALVSVKLFGAGESTFVTGNMATSNFALDGSAATGKLTLNATDFATNGIAITGGSNDDKLTGSAQADIINGGAGKDTIDGLAAKDTINAGDGDDTIIVNAANQQDVITGGAGADSFTFKGADFVNTLKVSAGTAGAVRITDFVAGTDKIVLEDAVAGTNSIVLAAAQTIATAADLTAVYAGITAIGASNATGAYSGAVITVSAGAAAGTYLYINDATGAVAAADDMLINLTGITGTLTATDFTFA